MENHDREESGGGSWLMLTLMAIGVVALFLFFPPTPL